MPTKEEKKRGGVMRYRTIALGKGKYMHVAIVRKKGKNGGRTVGGAVRSKKKNP